jgi:hypothetical protein
MSAVLDRIAAERQCMETELVDARARRAAAALRVFGAADPDPDDKKALVQISDYVTRLELRLDLSADAATAAERQAAEEAEEAGAAERQRLEGEAAQLEGELRVAIDDVQRGARVAGERARAAVEIGHQLANVQDALGVSRGRAVGSVLGELIQVRCRDQEPSLVFDRRVMAAERLNLLECYPLAEAVEDEFVKAAPACSICAHPQRAALEQALADGLTLRQAEEEFGVSRSSISRHRGHGN